MLFTWGKTPPPSESYGPEMVLDCVTYRVSRGSFLHRYASTAEVPTGFHVPIRLYHSLLVHSLQHHAPCQKNWGHLQRCLCTRKAWTLQAGFWISVQIWIRCCPSSVTSFILYCTTISSFSDWESMIFFPSMLTLLWLFWFCPLQDSVSLELSSFRYS